MATKKGTRNTAHVTLPTSGIRLQRIAEAIYANVCRVPIFIFSHIFIILLALGTLVKTMMMETVVSEIS